MLNLGEEQCRNSGDFKCQKLMQSKHKRTILQVYETERSLNCENRAMQRSPQFTPSHKLLEFRYTDTVDVEGVMERGFVRYKHSVNCFSHFCYSYFHFK